MSVNEHLKQSRESRGGAEKDSNETKGSLVFLRKFLSAAIRLPVTASTFLFLPARTNQSRRDLIQGRFWRLIPSDRFAPMVTRLPKPKKQEPVNELPRSIRGINIEPVPPTNLGNRPTTPTIPVHRPPGAIDEFQFLAGCTRCGDCMTACPYDAIIKAPERLGSVAGTPVIEADAAACMMCVDFPCIASCEPGVLVDSIPPIMGTARVTEHLCLAHHHTTCTVCSERCPVDTAITLTDGKPIINEDICTGCGVCRYVCPAPENAILLLPAFSRPEKPR